MGLHKDRMLLERGSQGMPRAERCAQTKARNESERKELRIQANERQHARNLLSPAEQLKRLDWRLGKGVGAKKERARLLALINKAA